MGANTTPAEHIIWHLIEFAYFVFAVIMFWQIYKYHVERDDKEGA